MDEYLMAPPFSNLDVRSVKGSSGKCWVFHLGLDGTLVGCLVSGGYRIYGLKNASANTGQFFIECRNFQSRQFGMLSAIVPKKCSPGRYYCQLALTHGVRYVGSLHAYVFNFHLWKKTSRYDSFLVEPKLEDAIKSCFDLGIETETSNINLVYLNAILTSSFLHPEVRPRLPITDIASSKYPIQCSIYGPDIWFDGSLGDSFRPISIKGCYPKEGFEIARKVSKRIRREQQLDGAPKRLCMSDGSTKLYISSPGITNLASLTAGGAHMHLIPYSTSSTYATFAPITIPQLNQLYKIYYKHGPFPESAYKCQLSSFMKSSGSELVHAVVLNHNMHSHGVIVALSAETNLAVPTVASKVHDSIDGLFSIDLPFNENDFDLPCGLFTIFRGYSWPFVHGITEPVFELLSQTYSGKGLIRNCTKHGGNFEMLGERISSQSTGSLIAAPNSVQLHHYFRNSMNLSMLPHVKSIINQLQDQAMSANYTSGESLMPLYKKVFGFSDTRAICPQTIVTQNHFYNTVHKDTSCRLSPAIAQEFLQSEYAKKNKAKTYLKTLRESNDGLLPKSTTCCWTLRANSQCFSMLQFFVGIEGQFAFDLSSEVLEGGNDAGATFMSSLFNHCTTVPVWLDKESLFHLKGPDKMYNFAWGTNGGEWWKRKGYNTEAEARTDGHRPIREAMAAMRNAGN